LLTIAVPFLIHEDRVKQKSLFAQIRNREDYVNVLNNLRKVCEQNKLKVPEFSVW
jgi:predicted MarR family transcription regulator